MSSRPAVPPPIGQLVDVGGYRLCLVLVDSAHEEQYRRVPKEFQELLPQYEEQAQQQHEGLKALIASGSLDPGMLPQLVIDAIGEVVATARNEEPLQGPEEQEEVR